MLNQVLNEAISLVNNGETDKGLELLAQIQPTLHDEEKVLLAELYFQWGIVDLALEIMEELHFLYEEESQLAIFLAEIYIDLDREEDAIQILNKISTSDEAYPQVLLLLADLYQMQGLMEVSEQKLKEAKRLLPKESVIDFAFAELYFHQGKYQKAVSYYEEVLKDRSDIQGVHIAARLAESLSLSGAFEEALEYYEQAVRDNPEPNTIFGYGVTAYQGGFYKTAIKQLLYLKDIDKDFTSLYLYLAKSYEHEEMITESLEVIQEGIKADEYNKELFVYGGKIAIKAGQISLAEQFLREALALDPGHVEAGSTLTKLFLQDEKYDEVIDLIEEISKYEEEIPEFNWDLARAYHQKEQYIEALNYYERAYNFFKERPDFLEEYGYFLLEDGKREKGKEILKELLQLDRTNVEIEEILMQLEEEF